MRRFVGFILCVLLVAAFQSFGTNVKKEVRPPGGMELNAGYFTVQPAAAVVMVSIKDSPVYTFESYALVRDFSPWLISCKATNQNFSNKSDQVQLPDKIVLNRRVTGLPMVRAVLTNALSNFSFADKNLPDIRMLTCYANMQINKPDKTLLHSCPTIRML